MSKYASLRTPEEIIAENEDLLSEILIRLPAKPLGRFESVSKYWLSLISNPQFCNKQSIHQLKRRPIGLFICSTSYTHQIISFPLDDFPENNIGVMFPFLGFIGGYNRGRIESTCDSLSLCRAGNGHTVGSYYVCNLTTKQFRKLPEPIEPQPFLNFKAALAFNPLKPTHYKVVCVLATPGYKKFQIQIYSSKTDTWKVVTGIESNRDLWPYGVRRFFWNDGIYWFGDHNFS